MRVSPDALFGDGFEQDPTSVRIIKSSLGLTPGHHKPEALLIALILRGLQPFQGQITGNGQVVTGNGQPVTYDNSAPYELLKLFFWQRTFTTNAANEPVDQRSYVLEMRSPSVTDNQQIQISELE
jgi:hypothetical protein